MNTYLVIQETVEDGIAPFTYPLGNRLGYDKDDSSSLAWLSNHQPVAGLLRHGDSTPPL